MKTAYPKVSIIIATLNRAHLIEEMLHSVLRQTFDDWECLIIDDGSNDDTKRVVQEYIRKDKRFQYLHRSDSHQKGLPGARNYGIEMAEGDYIIFFDDDDFAHPQNIEICQKQLRTSKSDFCHYRKKSFTETIPALQNIPELNKYYEIGPNQIEQVVTNKIPLASCTVMWKKECFANNRFKESLNYAEEWECYISILLEGYNGVGIDEILYYNRKHLKSNTGEFWLGDGRRKTSQVKALRLVAGKLNEKKLLSRNLIRYFIQMGIFLKERSIIEYLLELSDANFFIRLKYRILYKFYPVIVIGYRTKKLLKQKVS